MKLLSEVLDRKNYLRLIRAFGGTCVWVPKTGNSGHREQQILFVRAERVSELKKMGWSVRRLAERYDLSEKRVYTILREHKHQQLSSPLGTDEKSVKFK